jgi:hypothetical protein
LSDSIPVRDLAPQQNAQENQYYNADVKDFAFAGVIL